MINAERSNHIVFGAGLIGGYVAGGLMFAGYPTHLVARQKVREELSGGLKITDYLENAAQLDAPKFVDQNERSTHAFDYLWLTVKCTAVQSSLQDIAKLVSTNTVIICCQNGLGSDQIVKQHFPDNTVLGAVVGYNVAAPSAGHLHRSTEGKLVVENHPSIAPVIARLDQPIFPASLSDDFVADQWAKLQLNLANPVGALSDIPVKAMLEQRDYRRIIVRLQSELLTVAEKLGYELPKLTVLPPNWLPKVLSLPDFLFKLVGQKMLAIDPSARLSMWWDLHQGKPTEIDFLNQAVVDAGQQVGVPTPINKAIVGLIKKAEAGQVSIGFSGSELRQELGL